MRRSWFALGALMLGACASQVEQKMTFADGTVRNLTTVIQPGLLNTVIYTGVEDPGTRQVSVSALLGTSAGRAALDLVQSGAIAGAGAMFSAGSNQVNIGVKQ